MYKYIAQVRRSVAAGELISDDLVEAVVHRRLCSQCGVDYNLISSHFLIASG
jgi:hypothetical protein